MNLPPLPRTNYMLYTPSDGYGADHLTSWDGWDDDQIRAYAEAAVLAERERCAKVCEDDDSDPGSTAVAIRIAAAIRALDATP